MTPIAGDNPIVESPYRGRKLWCCSEVFSGMMLLEYHRGNLHYSVCASLHEQVHKRFQAPSWYVICEGWKPGLWHPKSTTGGYRYPERLGCYPSPAIFGAE